MTTGFALGATLIVAIGAQNAFVLRQGLRREHIVPIVVFCIAADAMLMLAGVAGLGKAIGDAPLLATVLTAGGAAFLLVYGVKALQRAFHVSTLASSAGGTATSLRMAMAQAFGFTFLNPHVYLDTVLLLGSVGARQPLEARFWFVGGAMLASGAWFSALGFGARLLAPVFARPRAWRYLDILVGLTMLLLSALCVVSLFRA